MDVNGIIAIVTGGAKGLGLGIAQKLKELEATVIVIDFDKQSLESLDNEYIKYCIDLTNYQSVERSINDIMVQFGKINVLVNNAGKIYNEPLINITKPDQMRHSYESFKSIIDFNLNTVFIISSIVSEKMILKRTKGAIINISSISAYGNAGQTAYSAAKAGVIGLTKTWAKELGVYGIRTNAIAPGFISTQSTEEALSVDIIKHIKKNTPLRKLGNVEDIVKSVLFSIENDFLNGSVIDVNGGINI